MKTKRGCPWEQPLLNRVTNFYCIIIFLTISPFMVFISTR